MKKNLSMNPEQHQSFSGSFFQRGCNGFLRIAKLAVVGGWDNKLKGCEFTVSWSCRGGERYWRERWKGCTVILKLGARKWTPMPDRAWNPYTPVSPPSEEMGKYYRIETVLYEVLKTVVPPSKVETEEKGSSEIVFKAMGRAINKIVTIVELTGVKKSLRCGINHVLHVTLMQMIIEAMETVEMKDAQPKETPEMKDFSEFTLAEL
nr:hypothetical protein [Tanacetum cinerariifolium]